MMRASPPPSSKQAVGTVLVALIGPLTIWAQHFFVVYGAHHLVCATPAGNYIGFGMQTAESVTTVAALLALLLLIVKPDVVLRMKRDEAMPKDSRLFLTEVRLLDGVLGAGNAAFFSRPACRSYEIISWLLKNFSHREICANELAQLIFGARKCREIFFWKPNNVGFLMNELPKKSDLRLYKISWMTHGGDPVCAHSIIVQSISEFLIKDFQCGA